MAIWKSMQAVQQALILCEIIPVMKAIQYFEVLVNQVKDSLKFRSQSEKILQQESITEQ